MNDDAFILQPLILICFQKPLYRATQHLTINHFTGTTLFKLSIHMKFKACFKSARHVECQVLWFFHNISENNNMLAKYTCLALDQSQITPFSQTIGIIIPLYTRRKCAKQTEMEIERQMYIDKTGKK